MARAAGLLVAAFRTTFKAPPGALLTFARALAQLPQVRSCTQDPECAACRNQLKLCYRSQHALAAQQQM